MGNIVYNVHMSKLLTVISYCGVVLLVLILVLPVAYAAGGLANVTSQNRQNNTAKATLAKKQPEALQSAKDAIAKTIVDLEGQGMKLTQIADSFSDSCEINSQDRGWTVANWSQSCFVHAVRGFSVQVEPPVWEELSDISDEFTECTDEMTSDGKLETLTRPAQSGEDCEVPLQEAYESAGALAELHKEHVYTSFDRSAIKNDKDQIWIVYSDKYYEENLGCAFGSVFCENPRTKLIMAKQD